MPIAPIRFRVSWLLMPLSSSTTSRVHEPPERLELEAPSIDRLDVLDRRRDAALEVEVIGG